jgi:hypothetical protein
VRLGADARAILKLTFYSFFCSGHGHRVLV